MGTDPLIKLRSVLAEDRPVDLTREEMAAIVEVLEGDWSVAGRALDRVKARLFSGRMAFKRALRDRVGTHIAPEEWLLLARPGDIVAAAEASDAGPGRTADIGDLIHDQVIGVAERINDDGSVVVMLGGDNHARVVNEEGGDPGPIFSRPIDAPDGFQPWTPAVPPDPDDDGA